MNNPAKLVAQAEEALKVTVFKWSADNMEAASLFEKAGSAYRANGDLVNACTCFERAAKCHAAPGGLGWNRQAQALESAAKALPARAAELYQKSASVYMANGDLEGAVDTLGRAATALETAGDQSGALTLFIKTSDMISVGDTYTKGLPRGIELLRAALNRLTKARMLVEALGVARKLQSAHEMLKQSSAIFKMHIVISVLHLARGDVTAAQQQLSAGSGDMDFIRSDEYEALDELLRAWTNLDSEKVKAVTFGKVITNIEREVAMLARELDPLKGKPQAKPAPAPASTPSAAPPSTKLSSSLLGKPAASPSSPVLAKPAAPPPPAAAEEDDFPDLR